MSAGVCSESMFSVSDLLQPERPDPDPVSDHGRRHARAGAHPGGGGGAQGRLQHPRDPGQQGPVQGGPGVLGLAAGGAQSLTSIPSDLAE